MNEIYNTLSNFLADIGMLEQYSSISEVTLFKVFFGLDLPGKDKYQENCLINER